MFGKILNKASEHGTRLREILRQGANQVTERGNLLGRNVLNFADRQRERFLARNNPRVPPPPSVPTLGMTMRKIQQYEPDVYDEIARGVTGSTARIDPIGKMKPFTNQTLRRAVEEYTTNPIMAIRKYGKISLWDTSQVTDMSALFYRKVNFNANISAWNVSNVTDMSNMFYNARKFNQPIGNWKVSNVRNMSHMFSGATKFNQPIGRWDVSNVQSMRNMFYTAEEFNQPIGSWDVSNVQSMDQMFYTAEEFNQPIGSWDVSKVTNMREMFTFAKSFNQSVGNWNVSKVTDMRKMFDYTRCGARREYPNWYREI